MKQYGDFITRGVGKYRWYLMHKIMYGELCVGGEDIFLFL